MTRRQLAVPMVAALLGGAVTAAAMVAGGSSGTGTIARQQGLISLDEGGEQLTSSEIYERAAPGVVAIRANSVQPGAGAFEASTGTDFNISTGSGFVLDGDGRIVTNAHVVSGVTAVQVTFADGTRVPARVVGKDEETDLAVLAVSPEGLDLRPLELGDSGSLEAGDRVLAVGNPTGFGTTAGTGRVAGSGRQIEVSGGYVIDNLLETDAVIEPASSGGPLLGGDGRVVGITARLESDTGFAVPSDVAREVFAQLEENHKVLRPYLGIRGRATSAGVELLAITPDGPAERGGLQSGDVIVEIDGAEVNTLGGLLADVESRGIGDTVELSVLRDGAPLEMTVRLEERPATVPAG
jgi:S1-C subfamily serine protease